MTPLAIVLSTSAFAEDKADLGPEQRLQPDTEVRVDILDPAVETIRYRGEVDDLQGGLLPLDVELYDPAGTLLGVFPSGSDLVPTAGVGAYTLRFEEVDLDLNNDSDAMEQWEISVLSGGNEVPGRVWSKRWRIDAGAYGSGFAMDGSFYAVVDGGDVGEQAVVELRADGLAGYVFSLTANSDGINGGDGRSRDLSTGVSWSSAGEHSIYLSPPDPGVASYSWVAPDVTNSSLTPDSPCGEIIPGAPGGGATLMFESNVAGVAHLICDLDQDGTFDITSDTDFHLLADVGIGPTTITWDGLDNLGLEVLAGTYDCVLKVTVGEFHFVANDIETSYEGFRLFDVDAIGNRTGLPMFWNDAEVQYKDSPMPNLQYGLERSGPDGISSGAYGDATVANVNARSWGAFQLASKGNESLLDTYTWIAEDEVGPFPLTVADVTVDTDTDGLSDPEEQCLSLTSITDPDTDGDGASDWVEVRDSEADPLNPDSDGDGLLDGAELDGGTTPRDSDDDGLEDTVDPDDDDDGVGTSIEGGLDADGDGLTNNVDVDDDDDGVDTIDEDWDGSGSWTDDDVDGDGTPDFLDLDEDGDGLLQEDLDGDGDPTDQDSDADGVPDFRDPDDDGDLVPTADEYDRDDDGVPDDGDGDLIPNWLDPDDDDDGLDTRLEMDPNDDGVPENDADTDSDGDGTPDFLDTDSDDDDVPDATDGLADVDGDGAPNFQDEDDDGDTIPTELEDVEFPDGDPTNDDSDGDGLPNYVDPDDEDDTVPTADEYDRDGVNGPDDTDGDGTPDYLDDDDDNDGIPTAEEGDGDTDGDGLPDYIDPDSDNDTIWDYEEQTDDSDGDFLPDFQDRDDDDDGIDTIEELGDAAGDVITSREADTDEAPDTDGDRDPDWLDPDDDDDTIPTLQEGGFDDDADDDGTPNHHDLDSDGDGLLDEQEGSNDRDGDGDGNFVDVDADGDGYDDAYEGDVDSDADGTGDWLDDDDDDDGVRSLEEADGDTDGDGVEDRLDTDDDGDGIPTRTEYEDALTYGPTDDDDLDNWVDTDSDDDGVDDEKEGTKDADDDGVPNYLDPDGDYLSWYRGSGLSVACSGAGPAPAGLFAVGCVVMLFRRRNR